MQYVAGKNRKIHHGISRARDAIHAAGLLKVGCGIADTDFVAAFDWLVLSWVWQVLTKLGVSRSVVNRVQSLYEESITITVVNNQLGRVFLDKRGSLRQGGCASMEWFAFGIDPMLRFLEKRLQGIVVSSLPVHGPLPEGVAAPLPQLEERFKLMAYCDDVKPSVTSMAEFSTIDTACSLFERSSGCKLHRDPTAGKCKFLALGRWKGTLQQEDIPLRYLVLSDSLEMVGVELKSSWIQTRKVNGDIVQSRVSNTVNSWKSGKFMDLTSRPWSINTYAYSKVWFKSHTVDLRMADISSLTSKVKSWLYQDQLEKPEPMILHRPIQMGGLGLHEVKSKAQACLIRTFLETALNPLFLHSSFHTILYRVYVLQDDSISPLPLPPPYFSPSFFSSIKWVKDNTPLNIATMTTNQWYRVLLEKEVTMEDHIDSPNVYKKCRAELSSPTTDWETSWRRARMKGLGSEVTSFLWKLLHQILPTEERLSRILSNSSEHCKLCPTPSNGSLQHCLFECISTSEVGSWLLSLARRWDPNTSAQKLLMLEFICEPSHEMPMVWLLGQSLLYMWGVRAAGKIVNSNLARANLESKISLLRETRFQNEHETLREIFDNL